MFVELTFDEDMSFARKNFAFKVLEWLNAEIVEAIYAAPSLVGIRTTLAQPSETDITALKAFGTVKTQEEIPWDLKLKLVLKEVERCFKSILSIEEPAMRLPGGYAEELESIKRKIIDALSQNTFKLTLKTQISSQFLAYYCGVQVYAEAIEPGWWLSTLTFGYD